MTITNGPKTQGDLTMSTNAVIEEIQRASAYQLAEMAGCSSPDDYDSPGGRFLTSVRDAFVEAVTDAGHDEIDAMRDNGTLHYLAEGAVPIYEHAIWVTFVDLCAFNVDINDYVSDETDMTKRAEIALFVIAETLLDALLTELEEAADDCEESDD